MKNIKEICVGNGASDSNIRDAEIGEICCANAPQAAGFAYPVELMQALTTFSSGLVATLDSAALQKFVAPHMRVPDLFEYAVGDRFDQFARPKLAAMRRARGGEAPTVGLKTTKARGSLSEFALAVKIDKRDYTEEFARWQTERLRRMIEDALLEGTVAMLDAMAVETTISLASIGSDTTLDDAIEAELDDARADAGVRPNRILFGGSAWTRRKAWYNAKRLAGSTLDAPATPELFTQSVRAETKIMDALTLTDANALEMLAGDVIYAFYAQPSPGIDDPSNIKTGVGGEDSVYHGMNEQGNLHVICCGTKKELLPVFAGGVVKIRLTA